MKPSIVVVAVTLLIAASLARAGGDGKSVEERLAAVESRLDRAEARLDEAGKLLLSISGRNPPPSASDLPAPSEARATLSAAQRAALVASGREIEGRLMGRIAPLNRVLASLTPEQVVALQEVDTALARGTFGVTWGNLRVSISNVALDASVRWLERQLDPPPDPAKGEKILRATAAFVSALERGNLADLPTTYETWSKATK
jgi:hypothetical protein